MRHLLTICAILAVGARLTWAADADYKSSIADFRSLLVRLVAADTTNPPGNEARAVTILAARLTDIAKSLFYKERSFEAVLRAAIAAGFPAAPLSRLTVWLPRGRADQKRADAEAMVGAIAAHLSRC